MDGIGFLDQSTLEMIYSATKCWLEHNTFNSCYHQNMADLKDQVEAEYIRRERREEARRFQEYMAKKEQQK